MTLTSIYFLIEGFALSFFGIMGVQNLSHRDERLRMILGGILMYWMVQYIYAIVFSSEILNGYSRLSQGINVIDMTAEPTCCFLLLELCRPGWLNWRRVILNMAPFLILAALYFATRQQLIYYIFIAFFVLYGLGGWVAALYYIPKYNNFLRQHYSYDENINLSWLYYMLFTFLVLMAIYAICVSYDSVLGDCIYMIGSIVGWGMVCYFISKQESVLYELKITEREEKSIENQATETQPDNATPLIDLDEKIKERFIKPQLYLRSQLKLGDMAEAIGTNRTYLSRYLNENLHTTFYDYINSLRLQYAMTMIEKSEYNIQAIATIAGFNSYSTFRRTFIAKYGTSPQEYKKNH